jgi:hypothetical protein
MGSRKPSARRRQRDLFVEGLPDMGDAFARERSYMAGLEERRDEARHERACTSKRRYATAGEARDAIMSCESYGRRGLSSYRCPYCHGFHLTSHPRDAG